MKMNWCDKLISALAGVILLAVGVLCASVVIVPDRVAFISVSLGLWESIALCALAVVLVLCGIYVFCFVFPHKPDGKFVSQSLEQGELLISMTAMEAMVRKCVDMHGDLSVTDLDLKDSRSGVVIRLCVDLASGVSIPLTADTLQRQIKQYVQECSGVSVKEVTVYVSGTPLLVSGVKNEFEVEVPCLPGTEEKHDDEDEKQPAHSKLFHIEDPQVLYNIDNTHSDESSAANSESEQQASELSPDAEQSEEAAAASEGASYSNSAAEGEATGNAITPEAEAADTNTENAETETEAEALESSESSEACSESTAEEENSYNNTETTDSDNAAADAVNSAAADEEEKPYEG